MESESDEEGRDWSQLGARVLKRGEKDHAPDGTLVQQSYLQVSREAMYTALSHKQVAAEKHLLEADWDAARRVGRVRKQKGNALMTIGWSESTQVLLHPEEVVYLCQRGSLRCYRDEKELSLAQVMSLCLGPELSHDQFAVYANLKKLGFIVRRAPECTRTEFYPRQGRYPLLTSGVWLLLGRYLHRMAWRPLYTSYSGVYRDLRVVGLKPNLQGGTGRFDFYAWKPGTKFKKTSPPDPDFRIRVVAADCMPCLADIEADLALSGPGEDKGMRYGYRQFVFAVVDNGVISYLRAAETAAAENVPAYL